MDLLNSCLPSPASDDVNLPPIKVKSEKASRQEAAPLKRSIRNNRNINSKFGSATLRNAINNNHAKKGS